MKNMIALLIVVISGTLLVLSLDRMIAVLNHIPVTATIKELNSVTDTQITAMIKIAQYDVTIDDNSGYWEDLSILFFYSAQQHGFFPEVGIRILKQADYSLIRASLHSPANARLWYQLALVNLLLPVANEKAAKLLLMSIITGPYEVGYLIPRLNLCLLLFPVIIDSDDRDWLRHQIITAWNLSPQSFMRNIANNGDNLYTIGLLLQTQAPEVLQQILAYR